MTFSLRSRAATKAAASLLLLLLSGCATVTPTASDREANATAIGDMAADASAREHAAAKPEATPAPAAPGARPQPNPAAVAVAAAAQAAAQAAQSQRAFADAIKGAREDDGLFTLWTRDERVLIEIAPEQFGRPFFLTSNLNRGIGEKRLFGGMMTYPTGLTQIVEFRRVGQIVQLIAKNTRYTATPGTPEARAVAAGFSDSLLAAAPITSLPHPERKSVLIDANAVFMTDLPGGAIVLERTYRQPYGFDPRNSTIDRTRATPEMVTFDVNAHYALSRPVAASRSANAPAGMPTTPSTLPDVRSLFLGFHYTLAKLPDEPMRHRVADERVGFFTTERLDFTSDKSRLPVQRYITRWRLEKKDPSAELSEPKQPIVFWLDRTIPEKYLGPIRDGIVEWNKAFERIGYKDAIRVELQPENAEFDTSDTRHASVRWQTVARSSYGAIGPSVVDPRTGEILDADIGIDANNVRVVRNLRSEYVPQGPAAKAMSAAEHDHAAHAQHFCTYDQVATGEAVFGLSLMEARGELDPDSPDVDRFVAGFLKEMVMHEVGHTLGLRHNFRASTIYTQAQLADPAFTQANGISGSVMEYNPWNIALRDKPQGEYHMSTLGPYDYWAVEYGYGEFAAEREAAELSRIASRSHEPTLAYATDEDASFLSLDPQINQLDLGSEPLAFARKRFALVRELWERTEAKQLAPGESYSILRRNFMRGLTEATQGAIYASKYIGGLTTLRDRAGSGRDPLTPVPIDKQREALEMIIAEVFSVDSFRFSPAFLRRLSVSSFDIEDAAEMGHAVPTVDIAIDQRVLGMQRAVLNQLMGETVAQRLVNNETKVDDPKQALRLAELHATVHNAVWSELRNGDDIPLLRRNLQREYVIRVANALVNPASALPADARALLRVDANRLKVEIAKAQQRKSQRSPEAQAHLAESLVVIEEALRAPLVRQAV